MLLLPRAVPTELVPKVCTYESLNFKSSARVLTVGKQWTSSQARVLTLHVVLCAHERELGTFYSCILICFKPLLQLSVVPEKTH